MDAEDHASPRRGGWTPPLTQRSRASVKMTRQWPRLIALRARRVLVARRATGSQLRLLRICSTSYRSRALHAHQRSFVGRQVAKERVARLDLADPPRHVYGLGQVADVLPVEVATSRSARISSGVERLDASAVDDDVAVGLEDPELADQWIVEGAGLGEPRAWRLDKAPRPHEPASLAPGSKPRNQPRPQRWAS